MQPLDSAHICISIKICFFPLQLVHPREGRIILQNQKGGNFHELSSEIVSKPHVHVNDNHSGRCKGLWPRCYGEHKSSAVFDVLVAQQSEWNSHEFSRKIPHTGLIPTAAKELTRWEWTEMLRQRYAKDANQKWKMSLEFQLCLVSSRPVVCFVIACGETEKRRSEAAPNWVVYATVCNLSHCASVLMVTDAVWSETGEADSLKSLLVKRFVRSGCEFHSCWRVFAEQIMFTRAETTRGGIGRLWSFFFCRREANSKRKKEEKGSRQSRLNFFFLPFPSRFRFNCEALEASRAAAITQHNVTVESYYRLWAMKLHSQRVKFSGTEKL